MNAIVASQVRRLPTFLTLAFLLVTAYLTASLVNSVIAGSLALPVMATSRSDSPPPAIAVAPSPLSQDALAKLLGLPEPAEPIAVRGEEATPISLPFRLLGTMVANDPAWSIALIENRATRESNVYLVGEPIAGGFVAAIDGTEVRVALNGRLATIGRESGDGELSRDVPVPSPHRDSGAVRSLGNNRYGNRSRIAVAAGAS